MYWSIFSSNSGFLEYCGIFDPNKARLAMARTSAAICGMFWTTLHWPTLEGGGNNYAGNGQAGRVMLICHDIASPFLRSWVIMQCWGFLPLLKVKVGIINCLNVIVFLPNCTDTFQLPPFVCLLHFLHLWSIYQNWTEKIILGLR